MKFNLTLLTICFFSLINASFIVDSANASENNSIDVAQDYFKAIDQITKPPIGSVPILPCSMAEKKWVVTLLIKSGVNDYKLESYEGKTYISSGGDEVEIYKGNFSNESGVEYALVTTGGSMHVNTVSVYKLINKRFFDTNLDQIISNNLFPGYDISHFYMWVAKPFSIVKNGKTYLRFMEFPSSSQDYDKTRLGLCTYLWQGQKFILTGPNWTYAKPNGNLAEKKDCMSS